LPVVSTAVGVEYLGVVAGRDYLLAETATEFVTAVSRLVRDPALAASLGQAGAARAEAFRWRRIETALEPLYREAAAGSGTAAREASAAHAARSGWSVPAEIVQLQSALLARRRRSPAGRLAARARRRLRRSAAIRGAEAAAARWIEGATDTAGGGGSLRRRLARLLRRLARQLAARDR
jgi:hypothetical protein